LRWLPALQAAVWYLPAIAAALRVLLGLATPFAGGLALAYVLDIPARWFAIHLFGGRRGPGILLAYLALFGTVTALVGLVVPQLVQSVGSFAAALPGYLENAQALLELVQANYGVDTTSLTELPAEFRQQHGKLPFRPGPAVGPGGHGGGGAGVEWFSGVGGLGVPAVRQGGTAAYCPPGPAHCAAAAHRG